MGRREKKKKKIRNKQTLTLAHINTDAPEQIYSSPQADLVRHVACAGYCLMCGQIAPSFVSAEAFVQSHRLSARRSLALSQHRSIRHAQIGDSNSIK